MTTPAVPGKVPNRVRYEVFRRDNFTCTYCGRSRPEVSLTIDHVIPTVLGGTNQPDNLVTACTDCNSGKSSSNPDQPQVQQASESALKWSTAMREAAAIQLARMNARTSQHQAVDQAWTSWHYQDGSVVTRPDNWSQSVDQFLAAGLTLDDVISAIGVAMAASKIRDPWAYMCGVAWNVLHDRQEIARRVLADGTAVVADEEEDGEYVAVECPECGSMLGMNVTAVRKREGMESWLDFEVSVQDTWPVRESQPPTYTRRQDTDTQPTQLSELLTPTLEQITAADDPPGEKPQ